MRRSTPIALGQPEVSGGSCPQLPPLCKTLGPPRRSLSPQTSSPQPTGRDRGPLGDRVQWHPAWQGAGSLLAAGPSARPAPRSGCTAPSSSSALPCHTWPSTSATHPPTTCREGIGKGERGKRKGERSQPEQVAMQQDPSHCLSHGAMGKGGSQMCQSKVWEPRQRVRDGTVPELCQGYVHRGRKEDLARMGAPVRLSLQMGNARDAVMDQHSLGPIPRVRERGGAGWGHTWLGRAPRCRCAAGHRGG